MFARILAIATLLCTSMGCSMESEDPGATAESDDLWFAIYQQKELTAEESAETGPGYMLAVYSFGSSGSASSSTGVPWDSLDFELNMQTEGKGLEVTVSSQGEPLAERSYDSAFLRSGEVDEFWGAKECPMAGPRWR